MDEVLLEDVDQGDVLRQILGDFWEDWPTLRLETPEQELEDDEVVLEQESEESDGTVEEEVMAAATGVAGGLPAHPLEDADGNGGWQEPLVGEEEAMAVAAGGAGGLLAPLLEAADSADEWQIPLVAEPVDLGRPHALVIGDSMVRRAEFAESAGDWRVETWVPHDKTWTGCVSSLPTVTQDWTKRVESAGGVPRAIVFWLGGNDIYPRRSRPAALETAAWDAIHGAVKNMGRLVSEVVVVGPTPRPARDAPSGQQPEWEETAAWQLYDRPMATWTRECGAAEFISIGRRVCERRRPRRQRERYLLTARAAGTFFEADGVHLSAEGYARIAIRLPEWLRPVAVDL